jgi:hypothetical protein
MMQIALQSKRMIKSPEPLHLLLLLMENPVEWPI